MQRDFELTIQIGLELSICLEVERGDGHQRAAEDGAERSAPHRGTGRAAASRQGQLHERPAEDCEQEQTSEQRHPGGETDRLAVRELDFDTSPPPSHPAGFVAADRGQHGTTRWCTACSR
jgi:hypothetical protein